MATNSLQTQGSQFAKWPKYLAGTTPANAEKYEKNFIMFYFVDQGDLSTDFTQTLKYTVALPVPKDPLKATYSAGYNTGDVGAATRAALEAAGLAGQGNDVGSKTSNLMDKVKNAVAGSKGSDAGDTAKNATNNLVTLGNLAPGGGALSGVVQRLTKTVKNPYTFMIYTGPEFRSFSASWLMIPDNAEEAKDIQDICSIFKMGILPGMADAGGQAFKGIWKIPYLVIPEIFIYTKNGTESQHTSGKVSGGAGSSYKPVQRFKTCVLKSVDVDYAGTGAMMPTFYEDGMPSAVTLSISFQETVKLTQQDVLKGY